MTDEKLEGFLLELIKGQNIIQEKILSLDRRIDKVEDSLNKRIDSVEASL